MLDKSHSQHPDTERLILRAAEHEFLTKGFDGARTTSIAEQAGVTHAMLHYYFRTKEKLFEKVIETKLSEMTEVVFGFITDDNLPIALRIENGMRHHFNYLRNNPDLPFFIINELRRKNSKVLDKLDLVREVPDKIRHSLQSSIDSAVSSGECRHVDALMLMIDILSLNITPFIANPIIDNIFSKCMGNREDFLDNRIEENIITILNKLKP